MANVYAKSGRKKSVFYVGSIILGDTLVDTGLTTAEFKANKVLADALDKQVIVIGLPDDVVTEPVVTEPVVTEPDNADNDGLPDDKEALQEIADSYGLEYNRQLGATKLKILIKDYISAQG